MIPHFCAGIRAVDTLKRQGVPSVQQGIAVLWTMKKEVFHLLRLLSAHANKIFAQFFEFGIAAGHEAPLPGHVGWFNWFLYRDVLRLSWPKRGGERA
jgi:hypothetical protein